MQELLDKMYHDQDLCNTNKSYDPIPLLKWIERKILAQNKDQYFYATVYDQECALHGFQQHNLNNKQYYDRFNTKFDVLEAISITRQHRFLKEDTSQ